jgi:glutamyl-tRNA synthetase
MDDRDIIRIAIKNALEHGGKANEGAVLSKVLGSDKEMLKDLVLTKKKIFKLVKEVNAKNLDDLQEDADELGVELNQRPKTQRLGLKDLPNVTAPVVLRLPPEPSGYMHLGHAIAGMINFLYKQKYNGKLWLRFEDTNPRLVKKEFVSKFEEGYKWLGIQWDNKKFITPDIDKIYSFGEKLLKENKAYVCTCPADKIKKGRLDGIECQCRERDIKENLGLFEDAKTGKIPEKKAIVRFKGNMKDRNLSLRDPNLFRIIDSDYDFPWLNRTEKIKLWPIYDFANVIEDELCGVTHVLRSNEFKSEFQDVLRSALGFKNLNVVQFSRFNFEGTPFSKRKIRGLIKDGLIKDWNDLRLPTITAIRRRGIQPTAIQEFVLSVGYSDSHHEYSWDLLFTLNRRIIDRTAKRFFFVSEPARLIVQDAGERVAKLPLHPSEDMGFRTIKTNGEFFIDIKDFSAMKTGDIIRLKDLYTIEITDKDSETAKAKIISIDMLGEEKIIQWVTDKNIRVTITNVGALLNKDGVFNADSLKIVNGLAENAIATLSKGDIIQFERFGFCILDDKEKHSFVYVSK